MPTKSRRAFGLALIVCAAILFAFAYVLPLNQQHSHAGSGFKIHAIVKNVDVSPLKHNPATASETAVGTVSEKVTTPTRKPPTTAEPLPRAQGPFDPYKWRTKSLLSTINPVSMHPDSFDPKRTYNTEPPNLPECHHDENIFSIYMATTLNCNYAENLTGIYLGTQMACNLPKGVVCKTQQDEKLADAVFKFVYVLDPKAPLRYCRDQVLIVIDFEAIRGIGQNYQQLDLADVRIDQLLTSDLLWSYLCIQYPDIYKGFPAEKYDVKMKTKGVALFSSDCGVDKFRIDYYARLMQYTKIDSYGKCLHNVDIPPGSRFNGVYLNVVAEILKSYRMYLTFENLIQEDYITEKIWVAYSGGAIPVYLGPPDIYKWVPGNHTFIDVRNFAGPKELGEYMQRVAEDDELYRYHTSNFDWSRTEKMMKKYCPKTVTFCRMCEMAYEKRNNVTLPK